VGDFVLGSFFTSSFPSGFPSSLSIVRYCSYCRASRRLPYGVGLSQYFLNSYTLLSKLATSFNRFYTLLLTAGQPIYRSFPPTEIYSNPQLSLHYILKMALLSAEHLAGPGYIILNVVRGLNIVALASVVASSIVMLVKTFIISKVRPATFLNYEKLTMNSSSSSTPAAMSSLRSPAYSSSSPNARSSATSLLATGLFLAMLMGL
jgi:hypothetical protein